MEDLALVTSDDGPGVVLDDARQRAGAADVLNPLRKLAMPLHAEGYRSIFRGKR